MISRDANGISIDYDEGEAGPTILIRVSRSAVGQLLQIFTDLVERSSVSGVRLDLVDAVAATADTPAILLVVTDRAHARSLRYRKGRIEWRGSQEQWSDRCALIAPLGNRAGFQYLTSDRSDDAVVIVESEDDGPPP